MRRKSAAIELSVNMLVMIIISLVVLGLGIAFLYQLLGEATIGQQDLDQRLQEELERLLIDEGQRVAMPLFTADVQRGERHIFGLGILNIGGAGKSFVVKIELDSVFDAQKKEITLENKDTLADMWLLYPQDIISLQEGGHKIESILVNVPKTAVPGQYIFKARVFALENLDESGEPEQYGTTQTFVVNVS
ncbi:hypothetical protein J4228_02650 [Candidatus Woesearchaeota archaeon]|nr:hypothetical protein [Candidatus Woesearchaeota archaeon]